MDALVAKGNAIKPLKQNARQPKGKGKEREASSSSKPKDEKPKQADETLLSIAKTTRVPSVRASKAKGEYKHVKDLKLRAHLNRLAEHASERKSLNADANELLNLDMSGSGGGEGGGFMEVEDGLEKTWRVKQDEIVKSVGDEVGKGRREWSLDGGPYRTRYTRNGRHLAIAGRSGHVAAFDPLAGSLHFELQLRETCRDITFLHDQSHIAVAQKKYTFIYDQNGVELHRLSSHIDVTRMEYLPFHWLLASIGNAGYLKYTDTSTGTLLTEQRTKLGSCNAMAQNLHNAVIYLGHANGTVTLRTPNLATPAVTLLAHLGPVQSISVDPSPGSGGRYMATAGADGRVKVWDCRNWKGCVREWTPRSVGGGNGGNGIGVGIEVEWSQKGVLGVASGGAVTMFTPPTIRDEHSGHPPVYLTHPVPHRPISSLRFSPYTDILTIGHSKGLSSILVPGAGEPNFDSTEADPFENRNTRREREVHALLDKIQPDLITVSDEFVGTLAPQTSALGEEMDPTKPTDKFSRLSRLDRLKASGKADEKEVEMEDAPGEEGEDEETKRDRREKKEKMKQRGKGKSLKRYLRKKRANVIDPSTIAIRQKIAAQKDMRRQQTQHNPSANGNSDAIQRHSALDRFRN